MKESQGDKGGAKAANLELSFKNKEPKGISRKHLSHEKKPPTFHYTGWLTGILTMVYYNPYIYQGFFHCSFGAGLLDYWIETSTNTFNCFAAGAASQAMYELSKSMKQPLPSGKLT